MTHRIAESIGIKAAPAEVWHVLTQPELMVQWMGPPEFALEVLTDWTVNAPVIIRGFHHTAFENKGIVLHFVPEQRLSYNHLSSVSRLPDERGNYTLLDFRLSPAAGETLLTLTIEHFPTETIFYHLRFYWRTAMAMIKKSAEQQQPASKE